MLATRGDVTFPPHPFFAHDPLPPTPRVRRTPLVADVVVFSALSSAFFCYSCPFLFPLYHPPFFAAHAPFFLDTHALGSKQSAEQATHTHKKNTDTFHRLPPWPTKCSCPTPPRHVRWKQTGWEGEWGESNTLSILLFETIDAFD